MSLKGTPVQCSGRVPEKSLENPSNYSCTCIGEITQSIREAKTEVENIQYIYKRDSDKVATEPEDYTKT